MGHPYEFINHGSRINRFYYAGDTVIAVGNHSRDRYIRKGRVFHKVNKPNDKLSSPATIYSNTNWELLFTIHYKEHPDDDEINIMTESFFKDEQGNLILDKTVGARRDHLVFNMENGLPLSLSIFKQFLAADKKSVKESGPEPDLLNFSFEYFEK
ncbi:hypothetical protein HDE68_003114 [Pedobacter cryoconitis]|uniref:Uncharacterized protein n=1 Tax=Pedobacter cryoconitis TaxID=188932 RepID=A0A7W8ZNC5_9SPHI|nr:hypothetical protein [Pedobacter cryoconitis]MBB5637201.1 hypothetical protein [Pedobacter cryoconitis]